jgi:hypothetical protein
MQNHLSLLLLLFLYSNQRSVKADRTVYNALLLKAPLGDKLEVYDKERKRVFNGSHWENLIHHHHDHPRRHPGLYYRRPLVQAAAARKPWCQGWATRAVP